MKEIFLKKIKMKLEKDKLKIEKQLNSFAEKDKNLKGDWDTIYPRVNSSSLEDAANEVEEYGNLLPIENTLELELEKINKALKKIKQGKYGLCEKCKKPISLARLEIYPRAVYCKKCQK
jgi:RNA polymerase-binding transcription factor DksA